jgi:CBS domain-containing membrane protein
MLLSTLKRFIPAVAPISKLERMRACLGALIGIMLTGLVSKFALGPDVNLPLLIAPMGASAVLLFAAPTSPLAQPWSILGGNILSAFVGVTFALVIPDPIVASALAVSVAIGLMLAFGCLHPPSGAVALTAVLGGPVLHAEGYGFVFWPVGLNSILLLAAALLFNNLTGRRYPHLLPAVPTNVHRTSDPVPTARIGFVPSDLQDVLAQYDEIVNVSPDELDALLHRAQIRAYERRSGEITCAQIMSRDVAAVQPQTPLREAWKLLINHRIKALPVTAADGGLVGIVTQTDFMRASLLAQDGRLHLGWRIRVGNRFRLARQSKHTVADIMTRRVQSAVPETMIAKLVPPMADMGLHHMPVVDANNRVVGIVTQSDLIAALFHERRGGIVEDKSAILSSDNQAA